MCNALGRAVAIAGIGLLTAASGEAASWTEIEDAADTLAPQVTEGAGKLSGVHGQIGNGDAADAFLFAFAGGDLHLTLGFDTPPGSALTLNLTVFDETGQTPLGSAAGELTLLGLPPGLYVAGVFLDADGEDVVARRYTLSFGAGARFAVPEPDALSLSGIGLLALALRRGRSRRG